MQHFNTVIIGGGQAGLATSYYLKNHQIEHVILEQAEQAGNAWRNSRWDSFALLTPNWSLQMPGAEYQGSDPDGFLLRDEIVAYFEDYIKKFNLPVRYGVQVTAVEHLISNNKYQVTTKRGYLSGRPCRRCHRPVPRSEEARVCRKSIFKDHAASFR